MKKLLMLLLVLVLAVGLIACTTDNDTDGPEGPVGDSPATSDDTEDADTDDETAAEGELVLSSDELAEYNGQDGSPAYIAVDGVIYDVTNSDMWQEGQHQGFEAGRDLTDELFDESPHGDSVLDRLEVVGRLED